MKTKMTPEEALSTLDKWRKCTIPMKKHAEAVDIIWKALKEKERQDAIINALKETIAYETSYPETRIDEEGNTSVAQAVALRQLKDLEERKRKMLRDWILRECFPKELKALEIIKEKRVFIEEFLQSDDLEEYNDYVEEQGRYDEDKLTQEEFDMLKECLI